MLIGVVASLEFVPRCGQASRHISLTESFKADHYHRGVARSICQGGLAPAAGGTPRRARQPARRRAVRRAPQADHPMLAERPPGRAFAPPRRSRRFSAGTRTFVAESFDGRARVQPDAATNTRRYRQPSALGQLPHTRDAAPEDRGDFGGGEELIGARHSAKHAGREAILARCENSAGLGGYFSNLRCRDVY